MLDGFAIMGEGGGMTGKLNGRFSFLNYVLISMYETAWIDPISHDLSWIAGKRAVPGTNIA
ncbi:MAG: hypothetical protein NTW95_04940 [Candidatus Aminicenantes bacterium]|nr:hypothetical protein [Candidatus Aminicenantes bacterium]